MTTVVTRWCGMLGALWITAAPAAAEAGSKFVERSLAAVPVPADGEFSTPDSVVTAFFRALNQGDLDAGMKCFVIRENFEKVPFRVEMDYLNLIPTRGYFPGLENLRLFKAMEEFHRTWTLLNLLRVNLHDTAHVRAKSIMLSEDPAERSKQIDDYERLYVEGMKLPYTVVASKLIDDVHGTVITKALGASGDKLMVVSLSVAGQETEVQIRLIRLGTNWRILNVTGPDNVREYLR